MTELNPNPELYKCPAFAKLRLRGRRSTRGGEGTTLLLLSITHLSFTTETSRRMEQGRRPTLNWKGNGCSLIFLRRSRSVARSVGQGKCQYGIGIGPANSNWADRIDRSIDRVRLCLQWRREGGDWWRHFWQNGRMRPLPFHSRIQTIGMIYVQLARPPDPEPELTP